MARWAIWSQVGFAVVGGVATLADQGDVPRYLFPPQAVLMLCSWSALALPPFVIIGGWRRQPGTGQAVEAVATVGVALTTLFALLPLVQ
jgi:hypothetical protein